MGEPSFWHARAHTHTQIHVVSLFFVPFLDETSIIHLLPIARAIIWPAQLCQNGQRNSTRFPLLRSSAAGPPDKRHIDARFDSFFAFARNVCCSSLLASTEFRPCFWIDENGEQTTIHVSIRSSEHDYAVDHREWRVSKSVIKTVYSAFCSSRGCSVYQL